MSNQKSLPTNLAPKRILVLKNRAIGDSLIGLSCLKYLKHLYPDAKITYALPEGITPIFKNINSFADEVLSFDLSSFSGMLKLLSQVLSKKFDIIFELHQGGRSGKLLEIFSDISGTPYYYHNHNKSHGAVLDQGVIKPIIQRDLDGVWSGLVKKGYLSSLDIVPQYEAFEPQVFVKGELPQTNRYVFGITATRDTKMWPLEFYNAFAHKLLSQDSFAEILIPMSTSKRDQEIIDRYKELKPLARVKFLQVPLEDLPQSIYGAKFYLGNDTGLKHLCVSMQIPTYTFFGPEDPLEWHPYNSESHKYFFLENLPCRTEISHYCPLQTCDMMVCLKDIGAGIVWECIAEDLGWA